MDDDRTGRVRGRAFSIWEAEGRPDGRHLEHWLQAEREVAGAEAEDTPDGPQAPDAGIARVIEGDESIDPAVEGAASLVETP